MSLNDLLGYFPPHLDGSLITLMNDAPPTPHTAHPQEQDGLDFRRAIVLQRVHKFFEGGTHEAAAQVLRSAWRENAEFGLFLRNFTLGAQVGERTAGWIETRVNTQDAQLQQHLLQQASPGLPFVAIQNPAFDFDGPDYIAKLSLADDQWLNVARSLVSAARLITFYFSHFSTGVMAELDVIRAASRQTATVLICDEGAGQTDLREVHFGDFPHVVTWGTQEGVNDLNQKVKRILLQPYSGQFVPLPPLGFSWILPDHIRKDAIYVAGASIQEAEEHARVGEILEGENALVRCIVLCCYGNYDEGRARAFLELARAQFHGRGKAILARANYERAIEIYRRLATSSETAAKMLNVAQQERKALADE